MGPWLLKVGSSHADVRLPGPFWGLARRHGLSKDCLLLINFLFIWPGDVMPFAVS